MGRITESHGNVERWRRNKYTIDFDAWTYESEVNLAIIGHRLKPQKRLLKTLLFV